MFSPNISTADASVKWICYDESQQKNEWTLYEFDQYERGLLNMSFINNERIIKRYSGKMDYVKNTIFEDIGIDISEYKIGW